MIFANSSLTTVGAELRVSADVRPTGRGIHAEWNPSALSGLRARLCSERPGRFYGWVTLAGPMLARGIIQLHTGAAREDVAIHATASLKAGGLTSGQMNRADTGIPFWNWMRIGPIDLARSSQRSFPFRPAKNTYARALADAATETAPATTNTFWRRSSMAASRSTQLRDA